MFITAKKINTATGHLQGKDYTYWCDLEVDVNDIIEAPFGKSNANLMVTGTDVDSPSFECKDIIRRVELTGEETVEETSKSENETPFDEPVAVTDTNFTPVEVCYMTCRVTGSLESLKAVKLFALKNCLTFNAVEQGLVDGQ